MMPPVEDNEGNWRVKVLIVGGVLGALLGVGSAYLMVRTAEEAGRKSPEIGTGDAIRIVIALIGLVRGIAALGDGKK